MKASRWPHSESGQAYPYGQSHGRKRTSILGSIRGRSRDAGCSKDFASGILFAHGDRTSKLRWKC